MDYVRIHDQGGTYPFTYRDGRDMVFTFRNNWSYGMQRETLVIVVQEGDESGPTLVYAWGPHEGIVRTRIPLSTYRNRHRLPDWQVGMYRPVFDAYQARFAPGAYLVGLPDTMQDAAKRFYDTGRWG